MERGQAYTLEGVIGAILIASALVVGLQAVDPAPWTQTDPVNPEELRTQSQDMLDAANDDDLLREAVTCADLDGNMEQRAFSPGQSPLGNLTERTIGTNRYRLSLVYIDANGRNETLILTDGSPGRTSVTVTRQFALFDTDPAHEYDDGECVEITDADGDTVTLGDRTDLYIENQDPNEELYAMVKIEVTVW